MDGGGGGGAARSGGAEGPSWHYFGEVCSVFLGVRPNAGAFSCPSVCMHAFNDCQYFVANREICADCNVPLRTLKNITNTLDLHCSDIAVRIQPALPRQSTSSSATFEVLSEHPPAFNYLPLKGHRPSLR